MTREAAIPVGETVEELAPQRRFRPYPDYCDSGVQWLRELPAHWETRRLKTSLCRNDGGVWGDDFDNDGTIVLRSTEQTVGGDWQIDEPARRSLSATEKAGARLSVGDLLVTKSSGSELHIGKTTIVTPEVEALDCCFSNFMQRVRCKPSVHPWFVYYILNSGIGREQFVFGSNSTTGLANLNGGIIGNLWLGFPSFDEQRAIAAFLDRETARIDELIAKQQRFIELLTEKRTALISQAVTKGLNSDAPMKDSSIDWVGLVPEHWEVVPLRWHFSVGSGEFISNEDMSREKTDDTPHPVIGGNGVMGFTGRINTLAPTIVLGRVGALCGNLHLVDCDCWVTDNALRLSMIRRFDQGYLALQLQTMDLNRWANMNAQPLITGGMVKEKYVALPPITEQQAIFAFLNVQAARLDELMTKVANAIDKLREYRSALISAAVTGKIDVRVEA